jgi:hypothetical protein
MRQFWDGIYRINKDGRLYRALQSGRPLRIKTLAGEGHHTRDEIAFIVEGPQGKASVFVNDLQVPNWPFTTV